MAGMWLELALTRVFSVLFFYNDVFVILAVAVLGISLGAAWVYGRLGAAGEATRPVRPAGAAFLAGASALGLSLLIVASVSIDGRLLLAAASAIPFLFIGMALAALFASHAADSPRLYWADLAGAGLGAFLAIPLFNWLGGLKALPTVAFLLALAGLAYRLADPALPEADSGHHSDRICDTCAARTCRRPVTGIAALLALAAIGLTWLGPDIDMGRLATPKPLTTLLSEAPDARIVHSDWDAFARVDVVETGVAGQKQVFVDGAAGSVMPAEPMSDLDRQRLQGEIGYFPFRSQPQRVFVIGPGGGKDVRFALLAGSDEIVAAELSPGVVQAVRVFGAYGNGRLYDQPGVNVAVDEGRSALRRSRGQFDLIYLAEPVGPAAERNSLLLAENYALTVEAFGDYLDHLTPDGVVALKLYDEFTLTRAFTTALQALVGRGLSEAEATRHIVVLLDPALLSPETPLRSPLLLVTAAPLTPEAAQTLLQEVRAARLSPLFLPHVYEQQPLSSLASGEITLDELVASFSRADISPTTDDRPFFYEFRHGLPEVLRQLLLGVAVVLLLLPGYLWWQGRRVRGPYWRFALYFGLLGAGFMAAELAMLQRLALFLGHPTTTLAAGLGTMLIAAGLGSLAGGRLAGDRPQRLAARAALLAALLLALAVVGVPLLTGWLRALPLVGRILVAIAVLFPPFFLLGMPFPLGLGLVAGQLGRRFVALAWGINGVLAVVGSVGAMALALLVGFSAVLWAVAAIYGVAAWAIMQIGSGD